MLKEFLIIWRVLEEQDLDSVLSGPPTDPAERFKFIVQPNLRTLNAYNFWEGACLKICITQLVCGFDDSFICQTGLFLLLLFFLFSNYKQGHYKLLGRPPHTKLANTNVWRLFVVTL